MEETPIGRMIEALAAVAGRPPEPDEAAQPGRLVGHIADDVLSHIDNPIGDLIQAFAGLIEPTTAPERDFP